MTSPPPPLSPTPPAWPIERAPHVAGPFEYLGVQFVVCADDLEVVDAVTWRFVDLAVRPSEPRVGSAWARDAGGSTVVFEVVRRDDDVVPWSVYRDGSPCESVIDSYLMAYLLWEVTRLAIETAERCLVLHAAAVERNGAAVVLVGESHAGKSTLSCWLGHHGWGVLSDELAIADPVDGFLHGFPRPFGIRRGGPLVPILDRLRPPSDRWSDELAEEVLVPISQFGEVRSRARPVVVALLERGDRTEVEHLDRSEALAGLLHQGLERPGGRLRTFLEATEMVAAVATVRLRVAELDRAEAALGGLVDELVEAGGAVAEEPVVWSGTSPGLVTAEFADGAVVIDLGRGLRHFLNVSASAVWRLLERGDAPEEIVEALASSFGARQQEIRDEVLATVRALRDLRSEVP